jgi:DNA (cytosine-5)-methyltransferase 1
MNKLRVLDLFSGIGGFSLGLERTGGFETVAFCEIEEFPRKVLRKHWPKVPIYDDVRTLDADGLGTIDCITGGYPCQPFSYAGKRDGAEDDRHLWPEMSRLIAALRPAWVIGENVAGHITLGLDDVLADLDSLGYSTQAFVIPACAVNAPHRRDRVWIVAHAISERGCGGNGERQHAIYADPRGEVISRICAPAIERLSDRAKITLGEPGKVTEFKRPDWWAVEPAVGRVAHGISRRVDRLKALGNAVVPQIPELIGRAILKSMEAA